VVQLLEEIRKEQEISRQDHTQSMDDLVQRGHQMHLANDKSVTEISLLVSQIHQAVVDASKECDRQVEKGIECLEKAREEHARFYAKSIQHFHEIEAVMDQRRQEAMQQELDALDVQEASIAAQKKELQANMGK